MSSDGCFRQISPAALQKVLKDPRLADLITDFHPPYDKATDAFYWPERVRELWDALLRSGGADAAACQELHAEMDRVSYWFLLDPEDLGDIAAAGVQLDEIPAGIDYCGAHWPDMHVLLTGTSPVAPGEFWRPEVPLTPLLGPRHVGTDENEGPRALTPEETAAAAEVLAAASDDEMRARYDDLVRGLHGELPPGWEEERETMVELFARVCAYYAAARERGSAMLVYMD